MTQQVDEEQLCDVLSAERDALVRLAHTLEVQRLVLEAGRADLLAESGRDVEDALGGVREADLLRAITVSAFHLCYIQPLQDVGVPANGYPTLGQLAEVCPAPRARVMRDLAASLRKTLARAMSLADENAWRLEAARGEIGSTEAVLSEDPWAQPGVHASIDEFLESIGDPLEPGTVLDDVERSVVGDESHVMAAAVCDLHLQAVTFDAALGVLRAVGCRPLVEFIADVQDVPA